MKKMISVFLVAVLLFSTMGIFVSLASSERTIVKNGLVAWYDGKQNTSSGHVADSTTWQDLSGNGNHVTVTKNENSYFTDNAYRTRGEQHNFPDSVLNVINGNSFTVEMALGDIMCIGNSFATFINSTDDKFALFLRIDGNYLEFKAAGNTNRIKYTGGLEYFKNSTVTITYNHNTSDYTKGRMKLYIDGVIIGQKAINITSTLGATGDLFFGHSEAKKSHSTEYRSMRFYNRVLTDTEIGNNATVDGHEYKYVNLEGNTTNIFGDIAISEFVTDLAKLNSYKTSAFRPANAIFYVDKDLKLTKSDGSEIFSTYAEAMSIIDGKIIPMFYVKDKDTADALIQALREDKMRDVSIISDSADIVKYMRQSYEYLRGIIDYRKTLEGKTLTTADLLNIRAECSKSLARVALLPATVGTEENVKYLNSRQITTWVSNAELIKNEAATLECALSGAWGIATDDAKYVYDTVNKYLKANSMTRLPAIIGHRGTSAEDSAGKKSENTLESAIAAYNDGADVIEIDIYITSDGHIVINHDKNTSKYGGAYDNIENQTLEELKALTYTGTTYKMPTLREYFEEFRGKDVMIFIEIKSNKTDIVTAMKALIDEYDMYGQCAVITYSRTNLYDDLLKNYPEMPIGGLNDMTNGATEASLPYATEFTGHNNTTLNPNYTGFDADAVREFAARGITIWPYTYKNFTNIKNGITYGFSGITSDFAYLTENMVKDIVVTPSKMTDIAAGQTVSFVAQGTTYGRVTSNITVNYVIVEGGNIAEVTSGGIKFNSSGTVKLFAKYSGTLTDTTIGGGSTEKVEYVLYSDMITLTSESELPALFQLDPTKLAPEAPEEAEPETPETPENPETPETPETPAVPENPIDETEENDGAKIVMIAVLAAVGTVLIGAGIAVIVVMIRKRKMR